jgi:hypothetical protein
MWHLIFYKNWNTEIFVRMFFGCRILSNWTCANSKSADLVDCLFNIYINTYIARFQNLPFSRRSIRQNHTILYLWILQKKTFRRKCNVLCQWAVKTILRLFIQLRKILVSMSECHPAVRLHFGIPLHWQGRIAVAVTLPIGKL